MHSSQSYTRTWSRVSAALVAVLTVSEAAVAQFSERPAHPSTAWSGTSTGKPFAIRSKRADSPLQKEARARDTVDHHRGIVFGLLAIVIPAYTWRGELREVDVQFQVDSANYVSTFRTALDSLTHLHGAPHHSDSLDSASRRRLAPYAMWGMMAKGVVFLSGSLPNRPLSVHFTYARPDFECARSSEAGGGRKAQSNVRRLEPRVRRLGGHGASHSC